jgi:starch phosphorylase
MSPLDQFLSRTQIAYFSMEMAIRPELHTYAGGLGVLAGDTARSCADLELPVVFVTLVSRAGYFRQQIDPEGRQVELPDWWDPEKWCLPLDAMVAVHIEGRTVWIRPWLYVHRCPHDYVSPILLLDSDLDQNSEDDRKLTHHLYGGDDAYRLKQEVILGIGGIKLLRALGFEIQTYHLNEGHSALLTLDLLKRHAVPAHERIDRESAYDVAEVRRLCVFTTHTPVAAGHDRFSYDLFERLLPDFIETKELQRLAGHDRLNLTQLALSLSGYVNGVARRHAETTQRIFPGHRIHAVTNGIHVGTWAHPAFARLFNSNFPQWYHEPEILVRVLQLADDDIWQCHREAKLDLVRLAKEATGTALDPELPILAFARRMTGYKRPMLIFSDLNRLSAVAARHPFQIVMAGKAHPRDAEGKEAIERIHRMARSLRGVVTTLYLPNYDMQSARLLVAGADLWLNTPLPPLEASGTSGMKAALNGVPNLSVLDGWWIEACIEGVTGWAIGAEGQNHSEERQAADMYEKLSGTVLPLFQAQPAQWRSMMKQTIANVAYYFNSQRMMRRYATEAYLR